MIYSHDLQYILWKHYISIVVHISLYTLHIYRWYIYTNMKYMKYTLSKLLQICVSYEKWNFENIYHICRQVGGDILELSCSCGLKPLSGAVPFFRTRLSIHPGGFWVKNGETLYSLKRSGGWTYSAVIGPGPLPSHISPLSYATLKKIKKIFILNYQKRSSVLRQCLRINQLIYQCCGSGAALKKAPPSKSIVNDKLRFFLF